MTRSSRRRRSSSATCATRRPATRCCRCSRTVRRASGSSPPRRSAASPTSPPSPPLVDMLADNDDRDVILRHAGSLALSRIGDAAALGALSTHPSRGVRIAAIVALQAPAPRRRRALPRRRRRGRRDRGRARDQRRRVDCRRRCRRWRGCWTGSGSRASRSSGARSTRICGWARARPLARLAAFAGRRAARSDARRSDQRAWRVDGAVNARPRGRHVPRAAGAGRTQRVRRRRGRPGADEVGADRGRARPIKAALAEAAGRLGVKAAAPDPPRPAPRRHVGRRPRWRRCARCRPSRREHGRADAASRSPIPTRACAERRSTFFPALPLTEAAKVAAPRLHHQDRRGRRSAGGVRACSAR